nr:MAG TPA: hypothetical protein [Caudoviricetes sp.]
MPYVSPPKYRWHFILCKTALTCAYLYLIIRNYM